MTTSKCVSVHTAAVTQSISSRTVLTAEDAIPVGVCDVVDVVQDGGGQGRGHLLAGPSPGLSGVEDHRLEGQERERVPNHRKDD